MFNSKKVHTPNLAKCVALASVIVLTTACSGGGSSSGGSGGSGGSDGNGGGTSNISIVTPMTLFKAGGKVRISGTNLQNLTPVFASANITPTKQTNNLIELTLPAQSAGEHKLTLNGKDYNLTYRDGYTKVSSGHGYSCGILVDKTVECWGMNNHKQLGNGTTTNSDNPTFVKAPGSTNKLTNITDISVNDAHACAVNTSGEVLCWGSKDSDKRGDNGSLTSANEATPNYVLASASTRFTGATKVAVSGQHSCVLMTDKTVKCWGVKDLFRQGIVGTGTVKFPTTVPSVSNVTALAAGNAHTCALKGDKTVTCWGAFLTSNSGSPPTQVSGLTNVTQIDALWTNACALLTDKTVKCWGMNESGQIGNGIKNGHSYFETTPTTVLMPPNGASALQNVAKISIGRSHVCALLESGKVSCWGKTSNGQLAGTGGSWIGYPANVTSGSTDLTNATDISAGYEFSCIATKDSVLKCSGNNGEGQLGNGTRTNSLTLVDIAISGSKKQPLANIDNVKQVAAGPQHSCAVLHDKTIKCWGRNDHGQLGSGAVSTGTSPQPLVSVGNINNATQVGVGDLYSCALLEDKTVKCWGKDEYGATGNPSRVGASQTLVPATVAGLSNVVQLVVSKGTHSCALLADSKVKCWGDNRYGQLGNNPQSAPVYGTPVYVHTSKTDSSPLSGVKQLSAGAGHTCAVLNDNTVKCWGLGVTGQLGSYPATGGATYAKAAPILVAGLSNVKQVVAGTKHTCALLATGKDIKCWGEQEFGVLGNGSGSSAIKASPQNVRFLTLSSGDYINKLSAGFYHTCALLNSGKVGCWGKGSNKALAVDDDSFSNQASAVAADIFDGKVEDLSLGDGYSLFLQGSLITTTK